MTHQIQESTPPFFPTAAKNGIIIGVVIIIISLVYQLAGLTSNIFWSMLIGVIAMVLYAVASYRAVKEHRDVDLGGSIGFGRAFITGLVAAAVAGVVGAIFSIVYIQFIDPGSVQDSIDAARDMMESIGADEDQIDAAMKDAERRMANPMSLFLQGFMTAAVVGAIASVIIAAMMKQSHTETE